MSGTQCSGRNQNKEFSRQDVFFCDADETSTVRMKRLQKTILESAIEKLIQLGQTG